MSYSVPDGVRFSLLSVEDNRGNRSTLKKAGIMFIIMHVRSGFPHRQFRSSACQYVIAHYCNAQCKMQDDAL
jgi:hypothetical protein